MKFIILFISVVIIMSPAFSSVKGDVKKDTVGLTGHRFLTFNTVIRVNQIEVANVTQLVPRQDFENLDASEIVYPNEAYPMSGTPFGLKRWTLMSNFGAPCTPPPWGTLNAVNLGTGEVLWRVPLGNMRNLAPLPVWKLYGDVGVPNFGGGISTAGGCGVQADDGATEQLRQELGDF